MAESLTRWQDNWDALEKVDGHTVPAINKCMGHKEAWLSTLLTLPGILVSLWVEQMAILSHLRKVHGKWRRRDVPFSAFVSWAMWVNAKAITSLDAAER